MFTEKIAINSNAYRYLLTPQRFQIETELTRFLRCCFQFRIHRNCTLDFAPEVAAEPKLGTAEPKGAGVELDPKPLKLVLAEPNAGVDEEPPKVFEAPKAGGAAADEPKEGAGAEEAPKDGVVDVEVAPKAGGADPPNAGLAPEAAPNAGVDEEPNDGVAVEAPNAGGAVVGIEPNAGGAVVDTDPNAGGAVVGTDPNAGGAVVGIEPNAGGDVVGMDPNAGGVVVGMDPNAGGDVVGMDPNAGEVAEEPNADVDDAPNAGGAVVAVVAGAAPNIDDVEPNAGVAVVVAPNAGGAVVAGAGAPNGELVDDELPNTADVFGKRGVLFCVNDVLAPPKPENPADEVEVLPNAGLATVEDPNVGALVAVAGVVLPKLAVVVV
ncbi:Protein of unknown function [Cotesia congregata]|uniref:Uncharacterized protein n=1 Tax=Cotesia congregata TaxID=51543 RepID=A0A8J2HJY7_COTCN|nr:Protein of unknown function [Cotesia congregata]